MMTKDEVQTLIEDCENRSDKLSSWEAQFIDSVSRQFANNGSLSPKQIETLSYIWEKVT